MPGSPVAIGSLRLTVGALALTAYLIARGVPLTHLVSRWRSPEMAVAALGAAAYQPCFFLGIGSAGVPLGTLIAVGSAPVFTGVLAWLVLGQRAKGHWAVATAVCLVGLALLTGVGAASGALAGVLLAAGAGLAASTFTIAAKRLMDRGVPKLEILASSFLLGSLVMLPVGGVVGLGWLASGRGLALALYLGVATMALANIFYTRGLSGLPAPSAATLTLADPLTATLLGVSVLGQSLPGLGWMGLAVLSCGLLLQGWSSGTQRA